MNNFHQKEAGKTLVAMKFSKNEFWNFIGCIISEVTYGNKGYRLWKKFTEMTTGIQKVKLTDMFMGRYIYKR